MLKRRGIIAKPGEYKYGDTIEVKTAEELKAAAERQPIIMLTKGHPVDGVPSAKDVIGTVSQKWSEDKQRVIGEFWFHEEKVPDSIRNKIVNLEPIPISPGFMIDGIGENGEQEGIVYTHLAVLEDEDPRCPLGTCGVNVRLDSKEGPKMVRFDQRTALEPPEEAATEKEASIEVEQPAIEEQPKKEEAPPVVEEPVADTAETPAEPEPAVQKPEDEEQEEAPREPEVVIPASTSARDDSGITMVDGKYVYVSKIFRDKHREET